MNEDLLNVFGSFSEISLDCIEKQNEEIEKLQKQIDFLRKRENKLQTIEQMFKSGTVDLEELQKIVEGKK